MKAREAQFNSVQDRGNSMVLDRHPASETIEVCSMCQYITSQYGDVLYVGSRYIPVCAQICTLMLKGTNKSWNRI